MLTTASFSPASVGSCAPPASPDLMPNSREDHSLHFNSPRDTYREALYSSGADNPPIEVQMGLVGWALDDTSEESRAMVMGVLRKDEIEAEGSDDEDDDAEEWLEVRLRLAKVRRPYLCEL